MQAPPNQVLVGLSLFLTFFVMSPVLDRIYTDAYVPFSDERDRLQRGAGPRRACRCKQFMLRQTRETDLALFAKLANQPQLNEPRGRAAARC